MNKVVREVKSAINSRVGLINDNHEYDQETLQFEKEKRMMAVISKELSDFDELWKVTELEETQIKLEISDVVYDHMIEETVRELRRLVKLRGGK